LIYLNRPYKEFLNWVWLKERLKVDRGTVGIVDQQSRDYDDTIVKTKGNFWVLRKAKGKLGVQEYLNAFLKQTKYQIDSGVVLADIEENKSKFSSEDVQSRWLDIGGKGFPVENGFSGMAEDEMAENKGAIVLGQSSGFEGNWVGSRLESSGLGLNSTPNNLSRNHLPTIRTVKKTQALKTSKTEKWEPGNPIKGFPKYLVDDSRKTSNLDQIEPRQLYESSDGSPEKGQFNHSEPGLGSEQ
jgi:hypothetical protein